jgi:transposase-like protein
MPDRRRARVAQYAERVNRALGLLRRLPPAAVLRALARRYGVSPRQARRYVEAAQEHPEGVPVPEATVVFTVKLPVSLARRLRALARTCPFRLTHPGVRRTRLRPFVNSTGP